MKPLELPDPWRKNACVFRIRMKKKNELLKLISDDGKGVNVCRIDGDKTVKGVRLKDRT